MNTKHTPGPWLQYADTNIVICKWRGPGAESLRICEIATNTRNDEGWHNLSLIIAAPDLLRVAELVVSWLDEEPGAHKLCDAARAAIAKAIGEKQ